MISKDEAQEEIIELWRNNGGRGGLEAVTGFGKSYLLNKICNRTLEKNPEAEIHFIVHSKVLKNQVIAQVDKRVKVFIINTYVKKKRECDLLLVDECDLMAAPTFSKIFSICRYRFIFCVTASLERSDGKHTLIMKYAPILKTIGFKEALENKWICDFEIYNMEVERPSDYDEVDNSFRKDLAFFHDDLGIMFKCMSVIGAREFIRETNLELSVGDVIGIAKRCRSSMQKRNELIYESSEKLALAKKLINNYPDKKIITFSLTKAFANKLTEEVPNSICIDADMKDKERDKSIELFKEGKYRVLNSIKIFERGFDAPDVDMGIIVSTTSVDRRAKQVIGRLLRYKEGKKALIIFLYLKGTKEKWTLKKAQKEIPNITWV